MENTMKNSKQALESSPYLKYPQHIFPNQKDTLN